jgi:hypothetical protein
VLGILDREWVELEDIAQDLEIARVRPVEVKPEEVAAPEETLNAFAVKVNPAGAVFVEDVAPCRLRASEGVRRISLLGFEGRAR